MQTCPFKWYEQDYIDTLLRIKEWFINNTTAIYFKEYFIDFKRPELDKDIPWNTLRQQYMKYESAVELWEEIVTMQEIRIIKWTIAGHIKSPAFGQFLLRTKHDYIETTKQQVEVTSKDIRFNFGNLEDTNEKNETETDI
jgi:hypothetical protein